MALVGYARVSTDGQSLTAQLAELKAAGCTEIFQEKISGAKSDRKQLTKLIGRIGAGDVLVVTRLDRLARSTRDLLNILASIADNVGDNPHTRPFARNRLRAFIRHSGSIPRTDSLDAHFFSILKESQ